jgi:hypothetical protein
MAWKSLKDPSSGLSQRPNVLAGPLLRKVTSKTVTVWVALRKPGKVILKVLDTTLDNRLMEGDRHTVAVGANLHIVAVTATIQPPAADLTEAKVYRYDLAFEFDGGGNQTLAQATDNAKLSYSAFDKPSFCLPPADLNQLRIVHGSCRIPHGNGADALPTLDRLIEQGADNPMARPHQLLLTGDQIYADDVGFAMSMMLMDASDALLGWTEEIVCNVPGSGTRRKVTELYPGLRGHITQNDAGFTSVDFLGQLVGLGEYLAMYLFVWSDVLWPAAPNTLPTFDQIESYFSARFDSVDAEVLHGEIFRLGEANRDGVNAETTRTSDFGRTVKDVRRALANVPTYMIFDDHEITDDWNMTRNFCKRVYDSDLGLRIVQNGLTAYALCQHWGNAPGQFRAASGVSAGEKLLLLLDGIASASAYDAASASIRSLLGIHPDTALVGRTDNGLFHDAVSLTYNYTVEGPGHQVIVTDTRSWRSYPRGLNDGGDLLPATQLAAQIKDAAPATGDRVLMVVLTTNAPPTQPVRTASRHPTLTKALAGDPFPDLYESWEMSRNATDLMFKSISDRLPLINGELSGCAILLSGDVHTSFVSRMLFKGSARFGDPQGHGQPVNMVFAQMVSSSLRKQTDKTEGMHTEGYEYAPPHAHWMVPGNKPEGYLGWNLQPGVKKRVGKIKNNPGSGASFTPVTIKGPRTFSIWDLDHGFVAEVTPDWLYRLDYLLAVQQATLPSVPPPIPPMPTGNTDADRKRAAEAFNKATGSYRKYNAANVTRREIVGVNNIGEITFDWGAAPNARFALHTLRWRDWQLAADVFTTYVCSLDPKDQMFAPEKVGPLNP